MKKTASLIAILLILAALSAFSLKEKKEPAAHSFEGVITYSVTADDEKETALLKAAGLSKVYMKKDMTVSVAALIGTINTYIIDSKRPDEQIYLEEYYGKKYWVKPDTGL